MSLNNFKNRRAMLIQTKKASCHAGFSAHLRMIWMGFWGVAAAFPMIAEAGGKSEQVVQKEIFAESAWLDPHVTLTGEAWRNMDGGVTTGSSWNYLVDLSAEVDLSKACGWVDGASLAMQVLGLGNSSGSSVNDRTGAFNPASGIMAGNALRFYNLHYRQSWNDEQVVMKLGQMAADDDFMGSDFSGLFMNSSFGAMPSQVGNPMASAKYDSAAFPVFAVAAPGAYFSYAPNESWFAQAAAFVGAPGTDSSSNHGFDWETGSDAGIAMFYESGWHHQLAGRCGTVKLGGTLHSGLFDDYGAQSAGIADATTRGIHSFYVIWDQALIENEHGDPLIGAFCRCGWSPLEDRSAVKAYEDLGVVWNSPFGRDEDALGLAVACSHLSSQYRDVAGSSSCETALEMNYRAQISKHWAVQCALQWVADPADSASGGGNDQALIAGLRTEFSF